jgi:hypothetical protein
VKIEKVSPSKLPRHLGCIERRTENKEPRRGERFEINMLFSLAEGVKMIDSANGSDWMSDVGNIIRLHRVCTRVGVDHRSSHSGEKSGSAVVLFCLGA